MFRRSRHPLPGYHSDREHLLPELPLPRPTGATAPTAPEASMIVVRPDQLTALADLARGDATATDWQQIAETIADELRRLAAATTAPPDIGWWQSQPRRHLRHAQLPHGVSPVTADTDARLVLDGSAA